jgi:hypothetical protein
VVAGAVVDGDTVVFGAIGTARDRDDGGCIEATGIGRAMKIRIVAATDTAATNDAPQRHPLFRRSAPDFAGGACGIACAGRGRGAKIASISDATDGRESAPPPVSGAIVMFDPAITVEQPPRTCEVPSCHGLEDFIGPGSSPRTSVAASLPMRNIGAVSLARH